MTTTDDVMRDLMARTLIIGEDGEARPCRSLDEMTGDFERYRRVARTRLDGGIEVSTVCLTFDHRHPGGPPAVFETMIFGGPRDQWCARYATRAEAEAGHARAVELATTPEEDDE
jgi:hypothetical protein